MLQFEMQRPAGSNRKQRLYACACCREVTAILADERCLAALLTAERFADGLADADEITSAFETTTELAEEQRSIPGSDNYARLVAVSCEESSEMAYYAALYLVDITEDSDLAARRVWGVQIAHDIFGNPFRPVVLNPSWLTSTVISLATGIYDERAFDRMPILADALQDAGCDNAEVLDHCRQPAEHVRGCWVVDLLLGKE